MRSLRVPPNTCYCSRVNDGGTRSGEGGSDPATQGPLLGSVLAAGGAGSLVTAERCGPASGVRGVTHGTGTDTDPLPRTRVPRNGSAAADGHQ